MQQWKTNKLSDINVFVYGIDMKLGPENSYS